MSTGPSSRWRTNPCGREADEGMAAAGELLTAEEVDASAPESGEINMSVWSPKKTNGQETRTQMTFATPQNVVQIGAAKVQ